MAGRCAKFAVLLMHRAPLVLQLLPGQMIFWTLVAGLETAINFCSSPMDTNPLGVLCT